MLVVWIAYANALHDNLTLDDVTFSPNNRSWDLDFASVQEYFTSDVWASIGKDTGLYRPLFLLSMAVEIQVFGEWLVGYHLVNVLLHSLVTIALFSLLLYLLRATDCNPRLAGYAALLSALVFAVHPVNTEVVNSIFNRSGMLVALGAIAGLRWFLPTVEKSPLKAWFGLNLVYLSILFCKETAIVFPGIVAMTLFLFSSGEWQQRLRRSIPILSMLLPIALFFFMRSVALEPQEITGVLTADPVNNPPVILTEDATEKRPELADHTEPAPAEERTSQQDKNFFEQMGLGFNPIKLKQASKVWFDSMVLMAWPHPLYAFHPFSNSNFWLATLVHVGLIALAATVLMQGKPGPLLGLTVFYLVLLPSSHIFGSTAALPHLAERSLYLPGTGIMIALSFLLYWLLTTFSVRSVALVVLSITVVLTPLTWARNADWASTISLAESDYAKGSRHSQNLQVLIGSLFAEGKAGRGRQLCDRHLGKIPDDWYFSAVCGLLYERLGMFGKAETAYLLATNQQQGRASAHFSLANLYLLQNKRAKAQDQFERAIESEQQAFMKEVLTADMLMRLYPTQRNQLLIARVHLETAIRMQPGVLHIQVKLDELNAQLGNAGSR